MSIIFGILRQIGETVTNDELLGFAAATQAHASDGTFIRTSGRVGMGFQPYHTHVRSSLEAQPSIGVGSNVISFDGRLDNHSELCRLLCLQESESSDSRIALAAFERWGSESFSHLIGDWALALWDDTESSLYLARDHAGTRSLYYECTPGNVVWSTYLETFFGSNRSEALDEEFVSLYCACLPTKELTPYRGIKAVPPAHYVRVQGSDVTCKAHWRWLVKGAFVCESDAEYEERFFELFLQSVRRRSGVGAPILAQLSGGMDSTSIVCMSDYIRRRQGSSAELLDTVSYYDNSEPNWNERPFFRAVEAYRGKTGVHLDASFDNRSFTPSVLAESVQYWPGADNSWLELDKRLHRVLHGGNFRVVLSGIGGDEVLGGVPSPYPELADRLLSCDVAGMFRSSITWCLANRLPIGQMLANILTFTCRLYMTGRPSPPPKIPPWMRGDRAIQRVGRSSAETIGDRISCAIPSRIFNGDTWWSIMESLPTKVVSNEERREYRYPYLDRDLVEFLFSIPRRQLVEPGRRRSLMRRALKDIVPNEVLERRRKAYLIRGPMNLIRRERDWLQMRFQRSLLAELGLVDPSSISRVLESVVRKDDPTWMPYLMRLVNCELWLGNGPLKLSPSQSN